MAASRHSLAFMAVLVAVLPLGGCSNAALDKAVGTTDGTPVIGIETSSAGVTIENRVGRPLLNIQVKVEQPGAAAYQRTLPTLDNAERKELRFDEMVNQDGEALQSPSSAHVVVTARDTLGNSHTAAADMK